MAWIPRSVLLLFLSSPTCIVNAQNLVPNPSFEDYTSCPTDFDQLYLATSWRSAHYSPDYWHGCGIPDTSGVPSNLAGYQDAHSGIAYTGAHFFTTSGLSSAGYREILRAPLIQPLIPNQEYHAEFYVNLTLGGGTKHACNNMGMLFTTDTLVQPNAWDTLPNFAHVYSTQIVVDTIGWVKVEGSFIADSAYEYVHVGNFFGDQETQSIDINPSGDFEFAYYFVDDVCVTSIGGDCGSVLVDNLSNNGSVRVCPNPFTSELSIRTSYIGEVRLMLYNSTGQLVYSRTILFNNSRTMIQLPEIAAGPYYLTLDFKDQGQQRMLLIHQ